MITETLIVLLILALAWANGANDVAKGVATLAGSGASNARRAIFWGTFWTFLGGLAAMVWGGALVSTFSRAFLVPGFEIDRVFIGSAIAAASLWVFAATRLELPVSTTHALLGGVIGAAIVAAGPDSLQAAAVANKALLPLLISPLMASGLCAALLIIARLIVRKLKSIGSADSPHQNPPAVRRSSSGGYSKMSTKGCGHLWVGMHWLSSAVTSFARGLNDVPKIAAFLILIVALAPTSNSQFDPLEFAWPFILVALVMGVGSIWGGFRVLNVLAHRVVPLDASRGLAANVGTSMIVLMATPLGLPVSTTHVSTGSLLGARWADKAKPGHLDALKMILFGWVVTLPVASALAATSAWIFRAW